MDLLRRVGEMETLDAGDPYHCGSLDGRPVAAPAQSSKRFRVALWKRWASARGCRTNVPGYFEGDRMAESVHFFCERNPDENYGQFGRKNDRPVRICATGVLADRHESRW